MTCASHDTAGVELNQSEPERCLVERCPTQPFAPIEDGSRGG